MTKESREAYALAQEELKKSREAMAEMNAKVMAEQAKAQPSPTIEEIQKATAPRAPRILKEEPKEVEAPKIETKESTPNKEPGGNYKTRDMSSKK